MRPHSRLHCFLRNTHFSGISVSHKDIWSRQNALLCLHCLHSTDFRIRCRPKHGASSTSTRPIPWYQLCYVAGCWRYEYNLISCVILGDHLVLDSPRQIFTILPVVEFMAKITPESYEASGQAFLLVVRGVAASFGLFSGGFVQEHFGGRFFYGCLSGMVSIGLIFFVLTSTIIVTPIRGSFTTT